MAVSSAALQLVANSMHWTGYIVSKVVMSHKYYGLRSLLVFVRCHKISSKYQLKGINLLHMRSIRVSTYSVELDPFCQICCDSQALLLLTTK